MKYMFKTYPVDIIFFILWSIILLPLVLLNISQILRIIVGIPFLFIIPGYMLIFILFPKKKDEKGIKELERIGLSIGFSIAIVSFLGLILNYTPWGIQLEPILISLFFITESLGFIALYRWKITKPDQRFIISFNTPQIKSISVMDKIITIFLALSLFLAGSLVIYVTVTSKAGENFTNFYIITSKGNVSNYPSDILIGENTSVILGIINHEYKIMNYTIEIWLIDESITFNQSTQKNDIIYNHVWFMDIIDVTLNHTQITNDITHTKKWEYKYTFNIDKRGHYKLVFLLFTTPSKKYNYETDYKDSIPLSFNNAYRELHLWYYVG